MIVSIHQPNFMPWLGFFDKISQADVFVVLDDSQFQKNVFLNKNRIKTANGIAWLTVPVKRSIHLKINEVPISNSVDWRKSHLKTIELAYKKTKSFTYIFPEIEKIYNQKKWEKMLDLNMAFIYYLMNKLDIKDKKIVFSSELGVSGEKSELLLNIVKKLGGSTYLSGSSGKDYLDEEIFKKNDIKVVYQSFIAKEYEQRWGEFLPNLSAIDYIFNS